MVVKTLSVTNLLEDTLPEGITMDKAEEALNKAYEEYSTRVCDVCSFEQ